MNDVDVIVVGAGGGGLAAALAAHDAGASVAVVEKLSRPGGNTGVSTGSIPGAGTRWQKEAGIADDPERLNNDLLRQSGPHEAGGVTRLLSEVSASVVEWLVDRHGVELLLITDYKHVGHSVPRLHAPATRKGQNLVDDLVRACGAAGIDIVLNNPVESLIVEDGAVRGLRVGGDRIAPYELRADSVILAANGYAANPELVRAWAPDIAGAEYFGAHGSTGEAIEWGIALGANTANLGAYQGYAAVAHPHGSIVSWTTVELGAIMLDRNGRRLGDETVGYSGFAETVLREAQPPAYVVFDTRIRDYVAAHEEEFRDLLEAGGVREFGSAGELAGWIGAPAENVRSALDTYHEAAVAGRDEFGRTAFGMAPLEAPYVVCRSTPGLFHTQGGLTVDGKARPTRADGSVVPGLYAVGGVAAGISGRAGGRGYSSGSGLLAAVGLGYIAGTTAGRAATAGRA